MKNFDMTNWTILASAAALLGLSIAIAAAFLTVSQSVTAPVVQKEAVEPIVTDDNAVIPAQAGIQYDEDGSIDTSNWKTYRNEEYGFEVKYPIDRKVTELENQIFIGNPTKIFGGIFIHFHDNILDEKNNKLHSYGATTIQDLAKLDWTRQLVGEEQLGQASGYVLEYVDSGQGVSVASIYNDRYYELEFDGANIDLEINAESAEIKNSFKFTGEEILDNDDEWMTYENSGVKFRYPPGMRFQELRSFEGFDIGEMSGVQLSFGDTYITVKLTSEDYSLGTGEGCCDYYAGPSVDVKDDLSNLLSVGYEYLGGYPEYILEEEIIKIGGRDSISYKTTMSYVNSLLVQRIITPLEGDVYSNVIFTGPAFVVVDGSIDVNPRTRDIRREVIEKYEKGIFMTDDNIDAQILFRKILDTVEFS